MPAYSFKERFVPLVKALIKKHTVRGKRKNPPRVGQTAYLYYAMRTKQCTKIGESEIIRVADFHFGRKGMFIDGKKLTQRQAQRFARADGFTNLLEMIQFWSAGHESFPDVPFEGDVIYWK